VSTHAVKIFAAYGRCFLRRRFHALRMLKSAQPPRALSRPLVIYLNHASWWDPLVCLCLSRGLFPDRTSFAPIDAASLEKYRFFKHIGMYGLERQSVRGALQFARTTSAILDTERTVVWLTPQGGFSDVRERPLRIRRGLGALAARSREVDFLPLAIEYTFWTEPRPEILVAFGEAITPSREEARSAEEWTELCGAALEAAQDELASRSCRRDPSDWLVLEKGARGVNVIYDAWRMIRARLSGAAFAREHRPETWA
jgi:1-acyl-sn-glycerol-3-phosphate acyltransferase